MSAPNQWPVGSWLSAALDDPNVCPEMKRDIRDWFNGGGHLRPNSLSSVRGPGTDRTVAIQPNASNAPPDAENDITTPAGKVGE